MKINNFNPNNKINSQSVSRNPFPKTKPMPMDSVSFSGVTLPKTNDEKFVALREKISKDMEPLMSESESACWDFYTNSTEENMNKMNIAQDKSTEFFDNAEIYEELKAINKSGGVKDKKLQKQLRNLTSAFGDGIEYKAEMKAMNEKENEISQKLNSYQMTIDGKPVSKAEIGKIMETEKNPEIRKKAAEAKIKSGDLIADDLVELVKMRNDFAKKKGYDNYFDMKLKEDYDIEPEELDKLLDDVASNILYEEGGQKDAFWEKSSADYFTALALGLFEDAKEEEVNLNSISVMTTVGEERFAGRSTYIKEYFNEKDPASAAYTCASGTVMAAEETKASILSTFKQKIRLFASREILSEMLSHSDFDMFDIGKHKTAVFLIIQDEKKTYHSLATIFVKQCYETLIGVAQETENGVLPVRTNFILDEFQNMPPLKDITTMVAAARSRHIRLTMIIQNFAGLDAVYGKEVAQTIRANCNNLLYLLTTELSALEEISKLCGDKKVKVGKGDKEHEESRPLITVAELQLMKEHEAIAIRTRQRPLKTKLYPNWKMNWGVKNYEADPFVLRNIEPIKVFDLKRFVEQKREEKLRSMMEDNDNENPFMGGNPFKQQMPMQNNPFMSSMKQDFDVNELVKKIDEKIAELEKEEQEENIAKQNEEKQEETVISTKEDNKPLLDDMTQKDKKETNNKNETYEEHKEKLTDDEFFDDFFDE